VLQISKFDFLLQIFKFIATIMEVKDSNGTILQEGDSVHIIKDLKVKGSSVVLKRGTIVKNIKLTFDEDEIEGKVDKTMMVLKTCFLKKV
jgi:protein PhnA